MRADIIKLLADREKPIRILKQFASATVISRQMLAGVQNKVSLRNQLKDFDTRLDYLYSEWLDSLNVKPDQLETQVDELKPSLIAIKFDESGDVLDNVDIAFKAIKEKYGDKQEVIDYLDFIDKPVKVFSRDPSPVASDKSPSISVAVGKGEEYVRTKFPKLIAEVESRFKTIKEKFSDAENMTENRTVSRQLENLESKIDDKSPFENLLKDAYSFPEFDKADIEKYEKWQTDTKDLIESLSSKANDAIDKKSKAVFSVSGKHRYNTFLKKQDPPDFSGGCLDYMEFKR